MRMDLKGCVVMTRNELVCEIGRVEAALEKTKSDKLRHDYGKYLKKLHRDLKYYDRQMKRWQTNRI